MGDGTGTGAAKAGGGCLAAIVALAVGLTLALAVAAVVDPFAWMPPASEIWADCADSAAVPGDECALERRYPGVWGHAIGNLAWTLAAGGLAAAYLASVRELRRRRAARFSGGPPEREVRDRCVGYAALLVLVALVPVAVAVL